MAKLYENRFFLLFIFLFAYLQSIYTRIVVRKQIDAYIFTPESATFKLLGAGILFLIILFFIRKWQKENILNTINLLKIFGSSLLVFIIVMQLIGLLIAFAFGTIDRNFNQHSLTTTLFSNFLDGMIYGSFFLTYYYYQNNKKHQQKLSAYNQALAESKIKQLKTQLNPHFLFNNLNILDQLIEEDKHKASDFLNEFANIYRYVLAVSDKDMIAIKAEVDFVQQYFKLIQHKYGNAYQLSIEHKNMQGFIVPLSLQLLIENAVQHNLGTEDNPIHIYVNIDEKINVSNNLNLKRKTITESGRALKNLEEQYNLLSKHSIEIQQTNNQFSVTIPIIHHLKT